MALRIELGLPAEPEKVPTEEERILAEAGDGYVTPAQRKRLRYLRKRRGDAPRLTLRPSSQR
ncbi:MULTISPECIES: hypothetical protein [unclassified Mesorhizobium]|uniref:hypothetical protein n=1 Tax=unclassified Mesorhizobium TaxID=325217 RepID=UPI0003D01333|nr:hypothetical protein [Mesorhizobium sp. L2C066B000]ESZ24614.1 hypothetical protein X732_33375 [Mesorhizobium sp. L2C066B000]